MAANVSSGVVAATLNPRGMVARIYIVNHYKFLHTKYRSCRLHRCRRFLNVIPHYIVSL